MFTSTSRCKCTEKIIKDARDLCYTNGIVFVAERGSSAAHFLDLKGEVNIASSSTLTAESFSFVTRGYSANSMEAAHDISESFSCTS